MAEQPISVVIPAHDEEKVIGRLLDALSDRSLHDEVIVVCDGCSDATAEIAQGHVGVSVIQQERSGKPAALNAGDRAATLFPRFYVDADVVVTAAALREVALGMTDGVEAGAPRLRIDQRGASWGVRHFYDVWMRLPYATTAVLGSGVMGLTASGRARFGSFPQVIGDDEFVRRLFDVSERVDNPAVSFLVVVPRRLGPLIRIKTRSRLGILQLDRLLGPAPGAAGERGSTVLASLLRDPRRWVSLLVFAAVRGCVGVNARRRLARDDVERWDRDESSRVGA